MFPNLRTPKPRQRTRQPLGNLSIALQHIRPRIHNSIKEVVSLPRGESCAAWIAVNILDFYNDVSTIWTVMAEDTQLEAFGIGEGFPDGVEYHWSDGTGNEYTRVSEPVYVRKVLQWTANQINDETKFPNDDGIAEEEILRRLQTPVFAVLCAQIFRRVFRVYGIIYTSFFGALEELQMAPHLNTCFKHFMFFNFEFDLISEKEMAPLEALVRPIKKQYRLAQGMEDYSTNVGHEVIDNFEFTGQVRIPRGVVSIKFHSCVKEVGIDKLLCHRNLRKVELNEGLVKISEGSFWGCTLLESISFPSTLTEVDERAFANCCNLVEVSLSDGIKKIGSRAFHNCSSRLCFKIPSISTRLEAIIQAGQVEIVDRINGLTGVERISGELLISAEAMQAGANWCAIKASIDRIVELISYHEIKEATTIVELALWKVKIDQAEENLTNRDACRIDIPGPVKDCILQYL